MRILGFLSYLLSQLRRLVNYNRARFEAFKIQDITNELPQHRINRYGDRSLKDVVRIIVHHSAVVGTPKSYASYHVDTLGWPGIGYHFVIDPDGTTYRTQPIEKKSYHTSGINQSSVGICLSGNFEKTEVPKKQMEALCLTICKIYRETGVLPIYRHNHYSNTACPGKNLDIEYVRDRVFNIWKELSKMDV